jgi:hypothetical protein
MLKLATIGALVAATSAGVIAPSPSLLAPAGVGCEGATNLTLEVDAGGHPYMSGFGKMICNQVGPGKVTAVLHKNGEEVARRSIETLETSAIAAVTVPCLNGSDDVRWLLVVQYSDEWIGMWMEHRSVGNKCGSG